MKQYLLLLTICCTATLQAQYKVKLILKDRPGLHRQEQVYAAGSFNGWNPGSEQHKFENKGDTIQLNLLLQPSVYEFKCTRGNWQKTEGGTNGSNISNRTITVQTDTVFYISIGAWMDDAGAPPPRKSTASANVSILSESFFMPQLNRYRRIWLYLPAGYAAGNKRYPVLYMQDGQNLFDELTAPYGEWGLDECLDSMVKKGSNGSIVVGIDHGGDKRMTEYNPYSFRNFGEGEGSSYVDFLANTLKPYIDKNYRTLAGKENTTVAGSSMGGLIATYAVLKYPQVFGGAGIFSPAYWTAPQFETFIDSLPGKINARLFFYAGEQESTEMVADMERIADKLALKSDYFIYSVVDSDGKHNEPTWRKWLPVFYQWMFTNRAE